MLYVNETGLKVGFFVIFFHHCVTTMSVHIHAYRHHLFETGTKTGL